MKDTPRSAPNDGRSRFTILFALVALLLPACSSGSSGCQNAAGTPGYCFCPQGKSCDHACTTEPSCETYCANGNPSCSATCGSNCAVQCQNAGSCTIACGDGCSVACQAVTTSCTATVGDGGSVDCEGAASCAVTCAAGCAVDCTGGGQCKVSCANPAACSLLCDKGGDGGAPLCADGKTRVCGVSC